MPMLLRSQNSDYYLSSFGLEIRRGKISFSTPTIRTATVLFQSSFVTIAFTQSPSGLYQKLVALKNAGGTDASNIEIGIDRPAEISKGECN